MNNIKNTMFLIIIFILIMHIQVNADASITMDVNMGFRGECKLGGLNPVEITIESQNQEVIGDLIIELDEVIYRHPVNVALGTKKVFKFTIPVIKANTKAKISILDKDKTIISREITPKLLSGDSVLIGFLSETPEELYYIKKMNPYFLEGMDVVGIDLDNELDYEPEQIDNFNVIVVDNFITDNLSKEKQEQLLSWIKRGGTLLIGTGRYGYKTLTGAFSGLNETKEIGSGIIIPIRHDIGKCKDIEVIENALKKNVTFKGLERLIGNRRIEKKALAIQELQHVADSLFKPTLNNILFLIALLFVYILLIIASIPWSKRPKIMVFGVIFGFTLLFYILAWSGGIQKNKAVCTGINIYENDITAYSLTNVYPYKKGKLSVDLSLASYVKELTDSKHIIDPIDRQLIYDNKEHHYLFKKEVIKGAEPEIELGLNGELLQGEIVNPTASKLEKCFLLIGDSLINVGEIEGKSKVKIKYQLDHKLLNLSDYNYIISISQALQLDKYYRELLEYYHNQIKEDGFDCSLLGFSNTKEQIEINGKYQKIKRLGLNVFPVRIRLESKNVLLPPGMTPPIIKDNGRLSEERSNEYLLKNQEELLVYYSIPLGLKPKKISLYSRVEGGEIELEVYNHKKKQWEALVSGKLQGSELDNYIEDGPLNIKIKGSGRIFIPQISVEGLTNLGDD
ncbi:hypothetical protein [Wukongibacter sp. M2B1]|uniref:hypothetical protein n=1 Tax=Wukongibacter sp. M2B1 TaxID=3088895 RepID=UPI003D78D544